MLSAFKIQIPTLNLTSTAELFIQVKQLGGCPHHSLSHL